MASKEELNKQKQFKALQKKWYAKLAKSGFEDIEWVDHNTGKGQNTPYMKLSTTPKQKKLGKLGGFFASNRYNYYRLASNFAHNYQFSTVIDKELWSLHAEGATYRQLSKHFRTKYNNFRKFSVFWAFSNVKRLMKICLEWNNKDSEGLLTPPSEPLSLADEIRMEMEELQGYGELEEYDGELDG